MIATYGVNVIIAKGLQENVGSFTGKDLLVDKEFEEKVEKIVNSRLSKEQTAVMIMSL